MKSEPPSQAVRLEERDDAHNAPDAHIPEVPPVLEVHAMRELRIFDGLESILLLLAQGAHQRDRHATTCGCAGGASSAAAVEPRHEPRRNMDEAPFDVAYASDYRRGVGRDHRTVHLTTRGVVKKWRDLRGSCGEVEKNGGVRKMRKMMGERLVEVLRVRR